MTESKDATPMTIEAAAASKYCPSCGKSLQYKASDPCTCGTRISFGTDSGTLRVSTLEKR